jgi:hypothetical protein
MNKTPNIGLTENPRPQIWKAAELTNMIKQGRSKTFRVFRMMLD